jgi:predicted double-glycine peptidase
MKKNRLLVCTIGLALILTATTGAFCQVGYAASWASLVTDNATCQGIDSDYAPVNRVSTFGLPGPYVYSWVEFHDVPPENHTITWQWYMPSGKLYTTITYTIPTSTNNNGWGSYTVWGRTNIVGYSTNELLGLWNIKVSVDGETAVTQSFTVSYYATSAIILGIPYYSQGSNNYCGPTALQMVLGYYGEQKTQSEIVAHVFNTENDTTYTTDMQAYPQQLGFNSTEFTGSIELVKQYVHSRIPVIVLQKVSETDERGHFRVVAGYDDTKGVIITCDPDKSASYNLTYAQFANLWQGGSTFTTVNWTLAIVPYSGAPAPTILQATPQPTAQPTQSPSPVPTASPTTPPTTLPPTSPTATTTTSPTTTATQTAKPSPIPTQGSQSDEHLSVNPQPTVPEFPLWVLPMVMACVLATAGFAVKQKRKLLN